MAPTNRPPRLPRHRRQHDEANASKGGATATSRKDQPPITAARITSVEGPTPPPGGYLSWDDYMADIELDAAGITSAAAAERLADYEENFDLSAQITKAMRLAPNIAVFNALMSGQRVPPEKMDPYWAKRYRLIRKAA